MKFDYSLSNILLGTGLTAALVITLPSSTMAKTGQEINQIAKETTVFIGGADGKDYKSQGSGVIISQNGNTYYVLTADHVVQKEETGNGKVKYGVITHDNKNYEVTSITPLGNNVDLAVIEFTSNAQYPVATLANSELVTEGTPIFVSGWPKATAVGGNQPVRQFSDGRVSTILQEPLYGYQMGYTNNTLAGMSGGPVFDAGGRLVAIHGLADVDSSEIDSLVQQAEIDRDSARQLLTTGFNYGIPIDTYLKLAPQAGLYLGLKVENTPPPELGANTVAEINNQMEENPDRIDTQAFWGEFMGDIFKQGFCQLTGGFLCPK